MPQNRRAAVFLLRYFHGRSTPELASALGVSEEAAKKRVSRALERLRQILGRAGITSSGSLLGVALTTYAAQPAPSAMGSTISVESAAEMAFWAAQTNQLLAAVEQSRRHIAEIEAWEEDYKRMKMRERATARLAEQAAEKSSSTANVSVDYRNLESTLKQIAARVSQQLAVRRDWDTTEKTPESREAFQAKMSET